MRAVSKILTDANAAMEVAKRRVALADLLRFTCDQVRRAGVTYVSSLDDDGLFTLQIYTRDVPAPPTAKPVPAQGPSSQTKRSNPVTVMTNTEAMIKDKGLTAPRVTPQRLKEVTVAEDYQTFPGTCLTVCVLTLANGFTVTGESACASPEYFDQEIGRKIARDKATEKIWALEGYLLKQQLYEARQMKQFDFSAALELLQTGLKVARKGWNGKGMWLWLQVPTETSLMTQAYIAMKTADDHHVPWLASQTDLLARDWELVQ